MQLSKEFKEAVLEALKADRANYGGSDSAFAKNKWNINPAVWSQVKNGSSTDGLIADNKLLEIGMVLNVTVNTRKWNVAETDVYRNLSDNLLFCKENSKSMVWVDDAEIGKTFCCRHILKGMTNSFYVDCSQSKTKQLFMRSVAKAVGVDNTGRYNDVKAKLKYYLKQLEKPLIVLDEAGDLDYPAFLEIKELWNATEGVCGYYLIGADGLEEKMNRGIAWRKVGYREIFSRFNSQFVRVVPQVSDERIQFYRALITDVLNVNIKDRGLIPKIVKQCLGKDTSGQIGGLRRAQTLLMMMER